MSLQSARTGTRRPGRRRRSSQTKQQVRKRSWAPSTHSIFHDWLLHKFLTIPRGIAHTHAARRVTHAAEPDAGHLALLAFDDTLRLLDCRVSGQTFRHPLES